MATSPLTITPENPVKDVCRLCDEPFNDKRNKHNLIISLQKPKPSYTLALEELTGLIITRADLLAVCSSCRTLLNRYHRSSCEAERIAAVVQSMSMVRTASRLKKSVQPTEDGCARKCIHIKHESPAKQGLGSSESSSQQTPTTHYRHTGCQTDPLPTVSVATQFCNQMVSVGTQLSYSTLKNHVRSKAVQVTICSTAGTETSQQDTRLKLPSTPGKASAPSLGVRPAKRPRLVLQEEEEEEEEGEKFSELAHDSTNDLGGSPSEMSGMESTCDYTDPKYIVFESSLRDLFQTCPVCRWECVVQQRSLGTFVSFSQRCPNCQYTRKWQSQPVKGNTPVGNLQMSAAVCFTGGSFDQMEKICKAMNLQMFHYDTFRRHARMFLEPAINHKWKTDQQTLIERLKEKDKIAVGGDMRTDSPGHSAKFGSYTLMHLDSNNIIDVQLVQSNDVGGSTHMEKEGLRRGLDFLEAHHLNVDYIVTNRHAQVQKYLKERNVDQYYDVWHLEKDLSKQLENLAKNKECLVVRRWLPSIKNHIYWSATASKSGPEKVAKWKSLVNHLQNVHTHEDPLFPKCSHPDRVTRDPNKWFQPGSTALNKVEKLLLDKQILRDVEKLSHNHQISSLAAFHSITERFTPKNDALSFTGRLCRLCLAAMHFNENAKRDQSTTLEGKAVYRIMFPNCSNGPCIADPVQTEPTFQYVSDLMKLLFKKIFEDPTRYMEDLNKISIPEDSRGAAGTKRSWQHFQETPGTSGQQHLTGWRA